MSDRFTIEKKICEIQGVSIIARCDDEIFENAYYKVSGVEKLINDLLEKRFNIVHTHNGKPIDSLEYYANTKYGD